MLDASRVQKELVEIERDKSLSGVSIQIYGDDLTRMCGTISGPVGTPYEGGIFTVDIHLPLLERLSDLFGNCTVLDRDICQEGISWHSRKASKACGNGLF